jgi:hypothetical protein
VATGRQEASSVVSAVLQGYADRGVFRGLHLSDRRGRLDAEFVWLLGRTMRATYEPRGNQLTFPALMPGVVSKSVMAADLRALVAERATAAVPPHKRIDRRRMQLEPRVSRSVLSLAARIRGENHEYAIRRVLSLINDMFLLLHASYPDYLVERFGLSTE